VRLDTKIGEYTDTEPDPEMGGPPQRARPWVGRSGELISDGAGMIHESGRADLLAMASKFAPQSPKLSLV